MFGPGEVPDVSKLSIDALKRPRYQSLPASRADDSDDDLSDEGAGEYLFGYYRQTPKENYVGSSAQIGIDETGSHDDRLPNRTDILKQLTGKHEHYNFYSRCDWVMAINNFADAVKKFQPFAVVCTPNKEVLGMITIEWPFNLSEWIEQLRESWETLQPVDRQGLLAPTGATVQDLAQNAYDKRYSFEIGYACTRRSEHPPEAPPQHKGLMRYLLYKWTLLIDKMFVLPAAAQLYYDQWNGEIATLEQARALVRRCCFFTLFALPSAVPAWGRLGFRPHVAEQGRPTSSADEKALRTKAAALKRGNPDVKMTKQSLSSVQMRQNRMFKPVFLENGGILVAPPPRILETDEALSDVGPSPLLRQPRSM